jgi:hypothetical protein
MDWRRFLRKEAPSPLVSIVDSVKPPAITPYQWIEAEFGKVDGGESMFNAFSRVHDVISDDVASGRIDDATHDSRSFFLRAVEKFCSHSGLEPLAPLDKPKFHRAIVDFLRIMEGPWERVVTAQLYDRVSGVSTQTNILGVLSHVTEEGIARILKDTLPGQEMNLQPAQIQEAAAHIAKGGVYSFPSVDDMEFRLTSEYKRTIVTPLQDDGVVEPWPNPVMTALGSIFRSVIYPHNIEVLQSGQQDQVILPDEAIKFSRVQNSDAGEASHTIFVSPKLLAVAMKCFQITPKCNVSPDMEQHAKEGGNAR